MRPNAPIAIRDPPEARPQKFRKRLLGLRDEGGNDVLKVVRCKHYVIVDINCTPITQGYINISHQRQTLVFTSSSQRQFYTQ